MEINTSHSQQNVALNQVAGSRKTATEELAERRKPVDQDATNQENRAVSADTLVLSEESLKRSQAAAAQPNDGAPQIANREQAQQVIGELISGVNRNPGQALAAYGNTSADRVRTLLN
ncbi:hypothetical protein A1507_16615 [Methylomonas koyamae]|uniref:Uncharacterized protein n=1 Tax=Methylomonas koyamae TaxID=702114 RepID=A0A177N6U2_9GAMM|nr:hypothetical protein [Methylomonas koyamae]OAI13707.1 hypothetical protein A1507_16615 [Methylomonas koyamae]